MIIEFKDISKVYKKDWKALNDINLEIDKGEFAFLLGPTGAGKSTLLKIIYMDERPTTGEITVLNYSSKMIKGKDIPYLRRKVGVIFQDFKLLSDRNVFDNIAFSLEVTGAAKKYIKRKVLEVLTDLRLQHRRSQYPYQISGGEQQKVSIGRALVKEPFILLADEPTGNVDPEGSKEIIDLLKDINAKGTTILMATHNLDIVKSLPFRVISMEHGKIIGDEGGLRRKRSL